MKLDFDRGTWSFRMSNGNCEGVLGRDGITVRLEIGTHEGVLLLDAAVKTVLRHRM